jgi:hypothetical protein
MNRDRALQDFIDIAQAALLARLPEKSETARVGHQIFSCLSRPRPLLNANQPVTLPACDYLPAAYSNVSIKDSDLVRAVEAFQELAPRIRWWPSKLVAAGLGGEKFAKGHANGTIAGPGGIEERSDVWIGASIVAPDVCYVDHHHEPSEFYLALSAGAWRQGDGAWYEPGVGGIVFNKPNVVHAMKSIEEPLFAFWFLLDKP